MDSEKLYDSIDFVWFSLFRLMRLSVFMVVSAAYDVLIDILIHLDKYEDIPKYRTEINFVTAALQYLNVKIYFLFCDFNIHIFYIQYRLKYFLIYIYILHLNSHLNFYIIRYIIKFTIIGA